MKKIIFQYPKFLLLAMTFIIAYFILQGKNFQPFYNALLSLNYFGTFIAGIGFAYSFAAAPSTAILLILAKKQNILISGLIAGFGALCSDLLIFRFIRDSFADEIKKISQTKIFHKINKKIPKQFRNYFITSIAAIIIASPLPDEIGITLLASTTNISTKQFSLISYGLNTAGIFVVLIIGKII
jgi:uncharacterized membrane protein YdjX (TVP38/TMEM64 family)